MVHPNMVQQAQMGASQQSVIQWLITTLYLIKICYNKLLCLKPGPVEPNPSHKSSS